MIPKYYGLGQREDLYLVEGYKVRKTHVASIEGVAVGARMRIDANEKYVVVAYFLANEVGKEKNGLCLFTNKHLIKIACKSFDKELWQIKLKDNSIYVQFRDGSVKAYKILAP